MGRRARDAEPGPRGAAHAGTGQGDAQAPWLAAGAGPPGRWEPPSLSGFSSGQSRRAQGRRPAAPRRAEEPGGRRGRAGDSGSRDPRRPKRPPAWPCAGSLLGAGRTRALPPPGMPRGASAAFPGRRAADTRPRPEGREGGGWAEGRGRSGGQRPGWLGSDPRRPAPPAGSTAAPGPLPGPPTGSTARPSPPTPDTGRPARIPGARFLFGTHNRCLGNKAAGRRHWRAQPPAGGTEGPGHCGSAERGGPGVRALGASRDGRAVGRGWGGASAGGLARQA